MVYDLGQSRSPTVCLRKDGLKRHQITLVFEGFSKPFVDAASEASSENLSLARELLKTFQDTASVKFPDGMDFNNWEIKTADFSLDIERKRIEEPLSRIELAKSAEVIIVPIFSALAELIDRDDESVAVGVDENELEGELKLSLVTRKREE